MKKQLFGIILAGFLLISFISFAQSNHYPVKTIHGADYYQYTIQPSEGLLAIGRKFNIPAEEIIKANPEVKTGLKPGQKILIPVPKKTGNKSFSQANSSNQFIQHKVEKKQTLFSISRKYQVSEEEIVKYNPDIARGLKEGLVLQIPKAVKDNNKNVVVKSNEPKATTENTAKNESKPKFITHKVQLNETLFSISRKYKVDIADIVHLNPGSESRLVVGSELKIRSTGTSTSKVAKKDSLPTDTKLKKEEIKIIEKIKQQKSSSSKIIKIAYLLPLMIDQVKKEPGDERFINFYEGSLLAIKEAKEHGISLEIYTYDTEKSSDRITDILNNPELKTVDLIIGPAYSNQVPIVENFAKENKINTLIPFTSKVTEIDTNPYLFQFNPGQDSELKFLADLITGKYKNTHVVFAEIQDISPLDEGKIRVDALQKKMTKEHRSFSTIELTVSENANFNSVLKKGVKNLVIFNTDKYANVSPFINSLTSASTGFDLVFFEQNNWRNQADKSLQSIFISPFISKLDTSLVNGFNSQYDYYFGKEISADSPRFDLLGYDLSTYFITLINRYGNKFSNKINSNNLDKGIQSQPLFERGSYNSGFINQRVYLGEDKAK